jgi:hypothetical protein
MKTINISKERYQKLMELIIPSTVYILIKTIKIQTIY